MVGVTTPDPKAGHEEEQTRTSTLVADVTTTAPETWPVVHTINNLGICILFLSLTLHSPSNGNEKCLKYHHQSHRWLHSDLG